METPVDPSNEATSRILKNLQGNILKGHGRDHTAHLFIQFERHRILEVKDWIRSFADEYVTSCYTQLQERKLLKVTDIAGGLFCAFFLSGTGYEKLGFRKDQLDDKAFQGGLKSRVDLQDPEYRSWEAGFGAEIDAMILLADDELGRMRFHENSIRDSFGDGRDAICQVNAVEYGNVLRNANGEGIEHFGYVDGVSQPLFLKDELETYWRRHQLDPDLPNTIKFDPTADVKLVLVKDPFVEQTETISYGSYFVFRKLEQNVKGFKEAEGKIGKELFPHDEEKQEIAGAYIVGRYENGSPVAISDNEHYLADPGGFNNFDYSEDSSGGRCPHFAHIRKTNPRTDLKETGNHKSHIMARRGIPFGQREVNAGHGDSPEQFPTEGVGLLFMSYQSSIVEQFEFIQTKWANTETFPVESRPNHAGVDLIIGHPHQNDNPRSYMFPNPYGSEEAKSLSMGQFVTMKGGEYFFAPSITFLKTIGHQPVTPQVI
jgi:Dyp-type peroxidase family